MMETIMDKIESQEFSARLNIASSFKVFLRVAYNEPATKDLLEQMLDSPQNIWLVLQKSTALSQEEFDSRYENPRDTALTIYLWALSLVNLEVAETAAGFIALTENSWWATRFAKSILQKKGSTTRSNVAKMEFIETTAQITAKPGSHIPQKVSLSSYPFYKSVPENFTIRTVSPRKSEKKLQKFACAWTRQNTMVA